MNYTEKLYKMRIDEFRTKKHRFPKASELKDIGINRTYVTRKYRSISQFYINLGYTEVKLNKKTDKIIMIDADTYQYIGTKYRNELESYYATRLNFLKRYKGKYFIFTESAYEVFKRCETRTEYKLVMLFKYDTYLFYNARTKSKYRNRRRRLMHMKETMPLEELIDVPKFADIEFL